MKETKLIKIGQYPSIGDILTPDIKKYRKVLSDEKLKEFHKAIGLKAHGVGIGSFAYLRRILEYLIEEAHQKAKKEEGTNWDEVKYETKKRYNEKVSCE